jgi:hypothetical protein
MEGGGCLTHRGTIAMHGRDAWDTEGSVLSVSDGKA